MTTSRITARHSTDIFIDQMQQRRAQLEDLRQELSSGIRISKPSDDAGKSGSIVNFQSVLQRLERHKERISYATNILQFQESIMESADNLLVRAKELATQGANETYSYEQRRIIAEEVFQIRSQLVELANSTYQGRYVYGAADDDDAPFDAGAYTQSPTDTSDPAYLRYYFDTETGTSLERSVSVSDSETVRVVSSGGGIFSDAIGALERLGRSLAGYRTSIDSLTNLPNGLGTAYTQPTDYSEQTSTILSSIDSIESARNDDILQERTNIGSRLGRLDQVKSILDNLTASNEQSRADLQDADIFDASARFSNLQTALQALLSSGAQINSLSLLNYI